MPKAMCANGETNRGIWSHQPWQLAASTMALRGTNRGSW